MQKKIVSLLLSATFVLFTFCGCGHEHEWAEKVIKEATCTQSGKVEHYCKTCDWSYEETVKSTGHNYDSGKITRQSSCTESGEKEYTCKNCKRIKIETIPSKHNYKETVTEEATCTSSGSKELKCSVCGETHTEEIKATGHHFYMGECSNCGAIKVDDLDADAWYIYKDLDILHVQNCLVSNATPTSKGAVVMYYPVCKECHLRSSIIKVSGPEYRYPVVKNYTCPECFATTTVRLEIS